MFDWKRVLVLVALVAAVCVPAIRFAPPGSSITLIANPGFVPAFGGTSTVTAVVIEPAGTPVSDGTVLFFFTNLGSVTPRANTKDGIAVATFVSDSRSGTATITAFSGGGAPPTGGSSPAPAPSGSPTPAPTPAPSGAQGTAQILVGNPNAASIFVTADPVRILERRFAFIKGYVTDAAGNPVPGVPVIYTVEAGSNPGASPGPPSPTEFMETRGTPSFSNNSGVAEDKLITQYPSDAGQKTVTVRGTTANGKTGTVSVTIN